MAKFTIETTYRLPVFRQRSYEAGTLEAGCRFAIEDDDWEGQKEDYESSGETYVTGIWPGDVQPYSVPALAIPAQFSESFQRKSEHYEVLLGLLKVFAHAPEGGPADGPYWRERADAAITKADFAEESPSTMIFATRAELEAALGAAPDPDSAAHRYVAEQLPELDPDDTEVELDLSGTSWEFFFQDIVKRSKTLRCVSVVAAFTCSKMRPDGFGGMAILIAPDTIIGKSTNDLIEDFLAEAGLDDSDGAGLKRPDPTPPSDQEE